MVIIQRKLDYNKARNLKPGFTELYGLNYQREIRSVPEVVEIANNHADLQILHGLDMGQMDGDRYHRMVRMVLGYWGSIWVGVSSGGRVSGRVA